MSADILRYAIVHLELSAALLKGKDSMIFVRFSSYYSPVCEFSLYSLGFPSKNRTPPFWFIKWSYFCDVTSRLVLDAAIRPANSEKPVSKLF
jgi:hypothetical protein